MGRKREITEKEADVLARLGHKIHYSYDPTEPVGRHAQKRKYGRDPIKRSRSPARISLTDKVYPKRLRKQRTQALAVYDSAKIALKGQFGGNLKRNKLCELIARETEKSEHTIQTQMSILIKGGYLKATASVKN